MKKKVAKPKRKKRQPKPRNNDGAGIDHTRMHGSARPRQIAFALHHHAQQKKSAHSQPAREEKIQSVFETAHFASRNSLSHGTENSQTPLESAPPQPSDAAPSHRHRHHCDRF